MPVERIRAGDFNLLEDVTGKKRRLDETILGKDDFLKLLITQLKTQNPLEPTGNIEFIAQLAEFSALEQMQNLNDKFDKFFGRPPDLMTMALPILGKKVVTATLGGNNEPISGIASRIRFKDGGVRITVGDIEVGLEDIKEVSI
ncbi:MAG: flagellar hook capping FlgD N-terminal domain-containing protein [bacterium]|nr:flagellar hook capping FlgD N-terminal domain-containing protein [bacterium]